MPYIPQEERLVLARNIGLLIGNIIARPERRDGMLHYVIAMLLHWLYERNYKDMNAALGVLEAVKQEFYREVVAPYEDVKKKENGEVYG